MEKTNVIGRITLNSNEKTVPYIVNTAEAIKDSLFDTSKEKYEVKEKLIENASDMSTQEKLEALDQNYACHCSEMWDGFIVFALGVSVVCSIISNPNVVKSIRRLVA